MVSPQPFHVPSADDAEPTAGHVSGSASATASSAPSQAMASEERKPLSLRARIFRYFLGSFLPLAALLVCAVEAILVPAVATDARSHLQDAVQSLRHSVISATTLAIRNHLRAIAEENRQLCAFYMERVAAGEMTRDAAVEELRRILLAQRVGESGYLYCLDSDGAVVLHPSPEVKGTRPKDSPFIERQVQLKEGYVEYEWRNPGEARPRKKALYMVYFEPLDWIISASSYRDEFQQLIDPEDLRASVLALRFGESGYPYILDRSGTVLIHPVLEEVNMLTQREMPADFVREMLQQGKGMVTYLWANEEGQTPRRKIAAYDTVPSLGWLVCASAYVSELERPIWIARCIAYGGMLLVFLVLGATAYLLSGRLVKPVQAMSRQLDRNAREGTRHPLPLPATLEMRRLAREFNAYLARIDAYIGEIRQERTRYRSLFEASPDTIFLLHGLTVVDCSAASQEIFGLPASAMIGKTLLDYSPRTQPDGVESAARAWEIVEASAGGAYTRFEWTHLRGDGESFDAEVRLRIFEPGEPPTLLAFVRDVTEERRLQERLNQAQKMESIGQLAGGVAHDFNNMLGGIIGAAQLLERKLAAEDPNRRYTGIIQDAADRAADLTAKLLAFARKGPAGLRPMDLRLPARDALELLRSTVDPRIELRHAEPETPLLVVGDAALLQSALMNLLINATHALPEGGVIHLRLARTEVTEADRRASPFELRLGPHAEIEIEDTGVGIDPEHLRRIFEPFFTTKEQGKGTGLGLAAVYGTVRQHHGAIHAYSEPGVGTRFRLLLPLTEESGEETTSPVHPLAAGHGRILLVDDETVMRVAGAEILEGLGYEVEVAEDGAAAVERVTADPGRFDLVLLDMIMPRMGGRDCFFALRKVAPAIRVLVSSGFSRDEELRSMFDAGLRGFIQKPFRASDLSAAVRDALDDEPTD